MQRAITRQGEADAARYIIDDMVEDVLERLEFIRLTPERALVIGDLTGMLALSLRGSGATVVEEDVRTIDEERPIEGSYDLIVSLASLDKVNDLPGALLHLRNALADDGMMLASVIGSGSLANLRKAMIAAEPERPSARMHPLIDNQSASALMQRALFKRQVVDSRTLSVSYRYIERLVSDLRDQGLGSCLAHPATPLSKAALERAQLAFRQASTGKDRTTENFEILTLTGWKN